MISIQKNLCKRYRILFQCFSALTNRFSTDIGTTLPALIIDDADDGGIAMENVPVYRPTLPKQTAKLISETKLKELQKQEKDRKVDGRLNRIRKLNWYIVDKKYVERFSQHVRANINQNDIIVEMNPGPGHLTRALLESGSNSLVAFEPNQNYADQLTTDYCEQFDNFSICRRNLERFYKTYLLALKDDLKMKPYLELTAAYPKVSAPARVLVIGTVNDFRFLYNLTFALALQCCFFAQNSLPIFYLCIPNYIYARLTLKMQISYCRMGIQLNSYYNIESLDEVPKSAFSTKGANITEAGNVLYLIKLSPKMDTFDYISREELPSFQYFQKTCLKIAIEESIINQLERWIPSCGPEFIKIGFRLSEHPRILSRHRMFQAFRLFSQLDSQQNSIFHHNKREWLASLGLGRDIKLSGTD